jgi:hypothetical protein
MLLYTDPVFYIVLQQNQKTNYNNYQQATLANAFWHRRQRQTADWLCRKKQAETTMTKSPVAFHQILPNSLCGVFSFTAAIRLQLRTVAFLNKPLSPLLFSAKIC